MVLLAILSAVIVPTLTQVGGVRREAAAGKVIHDLNIARQVAVARGTRTWVVFDVAGDAYALHVEDAANPGRANRVPFVDQATGKPYAVDFDAGDFGDAGLQAADIEGGVEIGFDYLGRPLSDQETVIATDGLVTLNDGRVIRVTARTGHVR